MVAKGLTRGPSVTDWVPHHHALLEYRRPPHVPSEHGHRHATITVRPIAVTGRRPIPTRPPHPARTPTRAGCTRAAPAGREGRSDSRSPAPSTLWSPRAPRTPAAASSHRCGDPPSSRTSVSDFTSRAAFGTIRPIYGARLPSALAGRESRSIPSPRAGLRVGQQSRPLSSTIELLGADVLPERSTPRTWNVCRRNEASNPSPR